MDRGLDIRVLVSPVHDCRNAVAIEPGGKRIAPRSQRWIMNPYDAVALEEALRLRQAITGSRVRTVSLALPAAEAVVRECVAVGADEAVYIRSDAAEEMDPYVTATVLAAALRSAPFDVVFCGCKRADTEHGQVGPLVAELLGVPLITAVRGVEPTATGWRLVAHKRIPGHLLRLSCRVPAVMTFEAGANLRYPTYAARRRAQRLALPTLSIAALGLSDETLQVAARVTVDRFTPPKPRLRSAVATDSGTSSVAGKLRRIMSGGAAEKKPTSKMWECRDQQSVERVVRHLVAEGIVVL